MAGFDLTETAARTSCPAVVVVTARDETVDPDGQRRLAAALQAGREPDDPVPVIEVEAGHGAPLIDAARFDPVLRRAVLAVLNRAP